MSKLYVNLTQINFLLLKLSMSILSKFGNGVTKLNNWLNIKIRGFNIK